MNARLLFALLAISPIAPALTALAQTPDPCATAPASCATLIVTRASAETRIPNTAIDVSISVSATGRSLPEVQRTLANKSNALLAYLRAQKVEPVSYTHLDVYKRQRLERIQACVSECASTGASVA